VADATGAMAAAGNPLVGWGLVTSLPAILLIAWVAGRLVGAHPSLVRTVAAGLSGWVAGTLVSLLVAQGDPRAPGFGRNVWVFSAVFSMSAITWLELLARPGGLARTQSHLLHVPRPVRAVRRASLRVRRYGQISRIAARHGFAPLLGIGRREDGAPVPTAARLRRALEEGGGMFVKLGQVMSTRSDLLPPSVVQELSRLQDSVAPADPVAMRAVVESELGRRVEEVFSEFDWEPLAAASIAQAYRARLRDGEAVVVKVQRPGIADDVERDVLVLEQLAATAEARTPAAREYHLIELAGEFTAVLRQELDFRLEARNLTTVAANVAATQPAVHVPAVRPELTTSRLLVMEQLDGLSVRDAERLDAAGLDRPALADALLRCLLQQMLVDGVFHADPHPGNVLVLADGRLGLLDFGAVGHLDALQQAAVRDMLVAVGRADAGAIRDAVVEVATVRRHVDDMQLERALARFVARHLGRGAAPSAAMLGDMLRLLASFGIVLPPEFSTLFRTLATLEGTLITLAPGYLLIEAAQQIATEWVGDRLTPSTVKEAIQAEALSLLPILRRVPRHADRIATIVERGDLQVRVSLLSEEDDVHTLTRLVNRGVLAVLGSIVGLLSVMLLGTRGGPPFTGDTSLFQFFGYFGLFCSSVLILRVIVAVLHDGLN
jgi:ubiquinone biosynthesis protein